MNLRRAGMWLLLAALLAAPALGEPAPPASVGAPSARESLRLRLTNAVGGAVEASRDGGRSWLLLGRVTAPALRVNPQSYTAAGWARDSAVAATAANAIHVRVATNPANGRPMTISLVPGGKTIGAATREPSATIYTDLAGGDSIFGGGLGPYVNDPVTLQRDGRSGPLPPDYAPALGDVLLIVRSEPEPLPRYAIFENRAGGAVLLDYGDGPRQVGVVDRPVSGIGRFEGAVYAAGGRIRANHPGVIDVSTSPFGLMGGFQIIPRRHARSPEMAYVQTGHQWLVIGPTAPDDPDWAGQPPFFSATILPSYRPDDVLGDHTDWMRRVLSRTSMEVSYGGDKWEPMPRLGFVGLGRPDTGARSQRGRRGLWQIPGELNPLRAQPKETAAVADHALEGIVAFRLVFPMATFWPE